MSIKLTFKKSINERLIKNYVLFTDENFKIIGLNKLSVSKYSNIINKTIEINKIKNKKFLIFNLNPYQKVILIKLKNKIDSIENEKIGAEFYNYIKSNSVYSTTFEQNNINFLFSKKKNFFNEFIHGAQLKSYEFNKYKTKKQKKIFEIVLLIQNNKIETRMPKRFESLLQGSNLTKDLVSEPGNILHPDEYVKRIIQLKKIGLKVNVYDEKKIKKTWNECFIRCRSRKYQRILFSYNGVEWKKNK